MEELWIASCTSLFRASLRPLANPCIASLQFSPVWTKKLFNSQDTHELYHLVAQISTCSNRVRVGIFICTASRMLLNQERQKASAAASMGQSLQRHSRVARTHGVTSSAHRLGPHSPESSSWSALWTAPRPWDCNTLRAELSNAGCSFK